jgi:hypothetical protein
MDNDSEACAPQSEWDEQAAALELSYEAADRPDTDVDAEILPMMKEPTRSIRDDAVNLEMEGTVAADMQEVPFSHKGNNPRSAAVRRRHMKVNTGIVLSSEKIKKFEGRSRELYTDLENKVVDHNRYAAGQVIKRYLQAFVLRIRRHRAVVTISKFWIYFKLRRSKRYSLFGRLREHQSQVLFSLWLGWRARKLLRRPSSKAKAKQVRDLQQVLLQVCVSNSKSPQCLLLITHFVLKDLNKDIFPLYSFSESDWKFMRQLGKQLLTALLSFHVHMFGSSVWYTFPPPGYWHLQVLDGNSLSLPPVPPSASGSNQASPRLGLPRTPPMHQQQSAQIIRTSQSSAHGSSPRAGGGTAEDRDDLIGSIFHEGHDISDGDLGVVKDHGRYHARGWSAAKPLMQVLMQQSSIEEAAQDVPVVLFCKDMRKYSPFMEASPVIIDERPIRPMASASAFDSVEEFMMDEGPHSAQPTSRPTTPTATKSGSQPTTPSTSPRSQSTERPVRSVPTPTEPGALPKHPTLTTQPKTPNSASTVKTDVSTPSSSRRPPGKSPFQASPAPISSDWKQGVVGLKQGGSEEVSSSKRKGSKPHIQLDVLSAEKLMLARKGPATRDSHGEILPDRKPGLRVSMFLPSHTNYPEDCKEHKKVSILFGIGDLFDPDNSFICFWVGLSRKQGLPRSYRESKLEGNLLYSFTRS